MKILIVRHGDPDYEHDSLTETGWKEAKALSKRLSKMNIKDFYVSPLGRAKDTVRDTLSLVGKEATVYNWLREFDLPHVARPDLEEGKKTICWDFLPQDWMTKPEFFLKDEWYKNKIMEEGDVYSYYQEVIKNLDALLETYGYKRDGEMYKTEMGNNDTICFVCHFGLECVLLSHLLNISPMILWHSTCALPTSVTTIATEERRKGKVSFRMLSMGDTSHLYAEGMEPSFAARFRECYENEDERRD